MSLFTTNTNNTKNSNITFIPHYQIFGRNGNASTSLENVSNTETLLTAISKKDVSKVNLLLEGGVYIKKSTLNDVFRDLIIKNNVDMVLLFLDYGMSISTFSVSDFVSIVEHHGKEQVNMIELLLRRGYINHHIIPCYYETVGKILSNNPSLAVFFMDRDNSFTRASGYGTITINVIVKFGNILALNNLIEQFGTGILKKISPSSVIGTIMHCHCSIISRLLELGVDLRKYFTQNNFNELLEKNSWVNDIIEVLLNTGFYRVDNLDNKSFMVIAVHNDVRRLELLFLHGLKILDFPNEIFYKIVHQDNNIRADDILDILLKNSYTPEKSILFQKNKSIVMENTKAALALAPAARMSEFRMNAPCFNTILGYIGTFSITNDEERKESFSNTLFKHCVFKNDLKKKPSGFISSLVQEDLLNHA